MSLEQESFDGRNRARVAHGDRCVVLWLEHGEGPRPVMESAIVMTPDAARSVGDMLREQADASEEVDP